MNNLPKDLQDIVYEYKQQLDFSECLQEINEIEYETHVDWEEYTISTRKYKNKETTMWLTCPYHIKYAIGIDFWITNETGTTWVGREKTFNEDNTAMLTSEKIHIQFESKEEEEERQKKYQEERKWINKFEMCLLDINPNFYDIGSDEELESSEEDD